MGFTAYPQCFEGDTSEVGFFDGTMPAKLSRPLSAPGSPRDRTGMMTPGDFGSLQEGREGLSTEDYIAWKLPEEDDAEEEYPFPLTLRAKKGSNTDSPAALDGAIDNPIIATGGNQSERVAPTPAQVRSVLTGESLAPAAGLGSVNGAKHDSAAM